MATLKKVQLDNEKELHSIIEKELDALEEGLELLQHEFTTSRGTPDFLCRDRDGRLVVVEVKLTEDENILFQALRYYSEVRKNRYVIANMFQDKKIKPELEPRIILVAGRFSDDLRWLATLVTPEVELYEYVILQYGGAKGIYFHQVTLPKVEEVPPPPPSFEELEKYIIDEGIRNYFKKVVDSIESAIRGAEKYPTRNYVGFRVKGRLIGYVYPHRNSFDVGAPELDENGRLIESQPQYNRVEKPNEDVEEIIKRIKNNYKILTGKEPQETKHAIQEEVPKS